MNRQELEYYLKLLGQKLIAKGIIGEIILAGGAVMLLVVRNANDAMKIVEQYVPKRLLTVRTQYLIEDLFEAGT